MENARRRVFLTHDWEGRLTAIARAVEVNSYYLIEIQYSASFLP
jgi:hypothetical protein